MIETSFGASAMGVDAARREGRAALGLVLLAAGLSAVVHLVAGTQLAAPWITPDELIYSELAKSIADGSLPAVRGETTLAYGLLYPFLIAPAWAVFDDPAQAYAAAKAINAVVMSSAAIPAFLLARRFVRPRSAAMVATASSLIPSLLLSGTLLIEVALYPVFLLALVGIVMSLQQPTVRNHSLALAGMALGCVAKPLSIVLVPAYGLAVLHLALLDRRAGRGAKSRLRRHAFPLGSLVVGGLAVLAMSVAAGNSDAVLGVYGVVLGNIDLDGTLTWFVWHLAALDLYVGVVPFAISLAIVGTTVVRDVGARENEFAAVAVWTIGGTLLAIAAYSSKPLAGAVGYIPTEARLHERNMFAVAPLLFVGLALFLERKPSCHRWVLAAAGAAAVGLPFLLPLERLLYNASFQALVVIPWTAGGLDRFWPLTFIPLAAIAAAILFSSPKRLGTRSWSFVVVVLLVTSLAAHASMSHPNGGASSTIGIGTETRWVDRALAKNAEVTALWVSPDGYEEEVGGPRVIWMNEFYNRTVETVVEVGSPMPYNLPHLDGVLRKGSIWLGDRQPLRAEYVLAPCWVRVRGALVARDARAEASVYRSSDGRVVVQRLTRREAAAACGSTASLSSSL